MSIEVGTEASRITRAARHIAQVQMRLGPLLRDIPAIDGAWDELNQAAVQLHAAGARANTVKPEDPLETLTRLHKSQAEGKALLTALENLLPLAEALDKARGNWVGDMADIEHGETPGTNYAEAIQELHLRLLAEVRGAKGGGRE
ncbi:hypothetical protein [Armatimonas sp.]|uniref:hypothetical protein n=1 Tax=Armatimonas sp. TaxID=1872638 RepID=UPI00375132ED